MSRSVRKVRETKETKVLVELNLDEKGEVKVRTPVPFFNHMLNTMLFYMGISAVVEAEDKQNYDDHHVVEDVGITLGQALREALGDRAGIKRFAHAIVPMDEALVLVAVDISGRGTAEIGLRVKRESIGGLSTENVPHFFKTFAINSGITLHVRQLSGENEHHVIEASFKGVGLSLEEAVSVIGKDVRSTKGSL